MLSMSSRLVRIANVRKVKVMICPALRCRHAGNHAGVSAIGGAPGRGGHAPDGKFTFAQLRQGRGGLAWPRTGMDLAVEVTTKQTL